MHTIQIISWLEFTRDWIVLQRSLQFSVSILLQKLQQAWLILNSETRNCWFFSISKPWSLRRSKRCSYLVSHGAPRHLSKEGVYFKHEINKAQTRKGLSIYFKMASNRKLLNYLFLGQRGDLSSFTAVSLFLLRFNYLLVNGELNRNRQVFLPSIGLSALIITVIFQLLSM